MDVVKYSRPKTFPPRAVARCGSTTTGWCGGSNAIYIHLLRTCSQRAKGFLNSTKNGNPELIGWRTQEGDYYCDVCIGRILARGMFIGYRPVPIWRDQPEVSNKCACCGTTLGACKSIHLPD